MRKCSAAGLDVLSTVFQEEMLPIVTPIVQQRLQEEDWRARESAILALGAIAEGCVMGLIPYLPQLVSMLLPRLEDPRPLVRSAPAFYVMPLRLLTCSFLSERIEESALAGVMMGASVSPSSPSWFLLTYALCISFSSGWLGRCCHALKSLECSLSDHVCCCL